MHYSALLFIMNTHIFAKNNGFYKHSLVYLSYRCSICHQLAKHVIAFAASSSLLHAAHNPLAAQTRYDISARRQLNLIQMADLTVIVQPCKFSSRIDPCAYSAYQKSSCQIKIWQNENKITQTSTNISIFNLFSLARSVDQ